MTGQPYLVEITEAGFPAVGTAGFYSWGKKIKPIEGLPLEDRDETDIPTDGARTLVLNREIQQLITRLSPNRVVFVADPDAVLSPTFGDAMSKLAGVLPCPLAIARIPYDIPHGKGVDDIREKIGQEAFGVWFQDTLSTATAIPKDAKPESIIAVLIEKERVIFPGLTGERREWAKVQISKLYASIAARKEEQATALVKTLEELARDTFQFQLQDLN